MGGVEDGQLLGMCCSSCGSEAILASPFHWTAPPSLGGIQGQKMFNYPSAVSQPCLTAFDELAACARCTVAVTGAGKLVPVGRYVA